MERKKKLEKRYWCSKNKKITSCIFSFSHSLLFFIYFFTATMLFACQTYTYLHVYDCTEHIEPIASPMNYLFEIAKCVSTSNWLIIFIQNSRTNMGQKQTEHFFALFYFCLFAFFYRPRFLFLLFMFELNDIFCSFSLYNEGKIK